jgi:hypothetical protein
MPAARLEKEDNSESLGRRAPVGFDFLVNGDIQSHRADEPL